MIEILDSALEILRRYPLCNHCLGRLFARLASGVDNYERGFSIKLLLTMRFHLMSKDENLVDPILKDLNILASNGSFKPAANLLTKLGSEPPPEKQCYICNNMFDRLDEYIEKIIPSIGGYEFNSFLIGTKIPASILEREDVVRSRLNIDVGESLKSELNRNLGKKLQKILGKAVSFSNPDIVILLDIVNNDVIVELKPLFIYGRYKKLIRGIPQTVWLCNNCWGKGCSLCNYSGRRYPTSISELIIEPISKATEGEEGVFHGAGREDVDTVTLGNGRPFIVEIKNPKRRNIDLLRIENIINENAKGKIEVKLLRFSNKQEVRKIKGLSALAKKLYQAIIEVDGEVDQNSLKKLEEAFLNTPIKQYTPTRVLHRRVDKVRIKKVYSVKTELIDKNRFKAIITCQGGLYVKELISGDNDRTLPNFSKVLGKKAICTELSILFVSEDLQ
ncbi:MAG: tRNA pseudouridine(54/55) synthase Pus10 [Candidatus Methanomethylicia archaeon]